MAEIVYKLPKTLLFSAQEKVNWISAGRILQLICAPELTSEYFKYIQSKIPSVILVAIGDNNYVIDTVNPRLVEEFSNMLNDGIKEAKQAWQDFNAAQFDFLNKTANTTN